MFCLYPVSLNLSFGSRAERLRVCIEAITRAKFSSGEPKNPCTVLMKTLGAGNRILYAQTKFGRSIHNFLLGPEAACVRVIGGTRFPRGVCESLHPVIKSASGQSEAGGRECLDEVIG